MSGPETILTIEEFLAHAHALETESVERYEELADVMEQHHNPELVTLFRKLAEFGRKHAAEVRQRAGDRTLPALAPWEFKWVDDEGPETGDYAGVHYLMPPAHALRFAMRNECRGRDYYQAVADGAPSDAVRAMAQEFANEEAEHVRLLQRWIDRTADAEEGWEEDLDPANVPE